MQLSDRKKIEQSIALLQEILGQKSTSNSIPTITIPGFNEEIAVFSKISDSLEPEIKELTAILKDSIGLMQSIINYSGATKAPSEAEKKSLQDKFQSFSKRTEPVEKNQAFVFHAKAIRQLISVTFWVLTSSPQFIIKGGIQSADFNAIKFQRNKNQGHNDWWKSIGKAFRIVQQFAKREFVMGLNYNSNGSASWNDILSGSGQPQTQKQQPQQQQTLAQNQPKPNAPKPPKKQLQVTNWLIANFKNEKITFAPGEVQMKHGIFIENCTDCIIIIDDKFKSLQMNKTSNTVLSVNASVSGVEVINGQNLEVHVKGQNPSISVDKCQRIKIIVNEQFISTDIVTSKASQCNISYVKDGNQSKSYLVGEQLITKWNPTKKKFETHIYDKFL